MNPLRGAHKLPTLDTRGSLAACFRKMSETAKGRPTGRRSATSGKAARGPLAKSALIYRAGWTLTLLILLK